MIINIKNLSRNSLRGKALLIAEAGYDAIDIEKVVGVRCQVSGVKKNYLIIKLPNNKEERINLDNFKRVFLIGIGKGSSLAVMTLAEILTSLGSRFSGGIVIDVKIPNSKFQISNKFQKPNSKIEFLTGTHPLPSKQNVEATQKIIKLADDLDENDLLITFICGGGSALFCGSEEELKYSQDVFNKLTEAGADIQELNTVRKHLSEVKGGGLAKTAYPATIISLIVSDVCGNDLSMIASGPTVFDKTIKEDAEKIWQKYQNINIRTSDVLNIEFRETPKDKKYFEKVKNILFICNQSAISAMVDKAKKLGFSPRIFSLKLHGEAKDSLLPMIEEIKFNEAILAGGETTVTMNNELGIKNYGKGGRNMEAVLGAVVHSLNPKSHILDSDLVVMSFASDGRDNTEAAGAIADSLTIEKVKELNLNHEEFLKNNKSFDFFEKTGDLIFTEQKSFNVSDLMLVLKSNH